MRYSVFSEWDTSGRWERHNMSRFAIEIENLDIAHKRAKKALRQQQKAITRLKQEQESQYYNIEYMENRVLYLELENENLKKEQTTTERDIQERIIKSLNNELCDVRTQLIETEEKYLKLLKRVATEDKKLQEGYHESS